MVPDSQNRMDGLSLRLEVLIERHLFPQLSATTTKHFQYKGKITQIFKIPDNAARLRAFDLAFLLLRAYPSADSKLDEAKEVEVIVLDVVRPDRSAMNPQVSRLPLPGTQP
jgi:hypothetical protein